MAIGINDLIGMMYQDGDIYDAPFTEAELFPVMPVINRPNDLEMLRRIQEFREPVTVEQLIASLPVSPVVPVVVPPQIVSLPDDFGMLQRMQEVRQPEPITVEQIIASLPVSPPVAPPPVISQPDDFDMLRRMQEFRETVPTVPVAPAAPRLRAARAGEPLCGGYFGLRSDPAHEARRSAGQGRRSRHGRSGLGALGGELPLACAQGPDSRGRA